jgi:hypothetical protein
MGRGPGLMVHPLLSLLHITGPESVNIPFAFTTARRAGRDSDLPVPPISASEFASLYLRELEDRALRVRAAPVVQLGRVYADSLLL